MVPVTRFDESARSGSNMEQVELWLKFLLASGIVIGAGLSLTRNAEKLAESMGWGHAFAGFVILGWSILREPRQARHRRTEHHLRFPCSQDASVKRKLGS